MICRDARVLSLKRGIRVLKQGLSGNGYYTVALMKESEPRSHYIHRLVAEHFIPNPQNLPEVNHKDGNKLNNQIENLEWVTDSQNKKHSHMYLNRKWDSEKASRNAHSRRLTPAQVLEIIEIGTDMSTTDLGKLYNVKRQSITCILNGKNWGWLTNISRN